MKPAEDRPRSELAQPLNRPMARRILVQRQMRSEFVVITGVGRQYAMLSHEIQQQPLEVLGFGNVSKCACHSRRQVLAGLGGVTAAALLLLSDNLRDCCPISVRLLSDMRSIRCAKIKIAPTCMRRSLTFVEECDGV